MRRRAFRAILPRGRACHDSTAHDGVAFVENSCLAPGDAVCGLVQLELEAVTGVGDAGRDRRRAVAKLRIGAVERQVEPTGRLDAAACEGLVRTDDDGVRRGVRVEHVQRALGDYADPAALAGRERPDAAMRAELVPALADDRPGPRRDLVPGEERAVVVPGEEARLLALCTARDVEARAMRLVARLLLALLAEWEPDPRQMARVQRSKHVALILRRIRCSTKKRVPAMLDDARVVTGGKAIATGALCKFEQLVEAERAVAANARVRRLTACVAVDERRDDGAAELLAQVERHVRDAEPVTRLPRRDDRLRRAARAFRARPRRIEPEP